MERTSKLAKYILWALMAISVVLFVVMISSIDNELNPGAKARSLMTMNINWSIIMFVVATILVLFFAVIQILGDKSKAIGAAISIALLAAVVGISYALSTSEMPTFFGVEKLIANNSLTPSVVRWVGTGLYSTYILFAGAILSIIGFGAAGIFKRS